MIIIIIIDDRIETFLKKVMADFKSRLMRRDKDRFNNKVRTESLMRMRWLLMSRNWLINPTCNSLSLSEVQTGGDAGFEPNYFTERSFPQHKQGTRARGILA